MSRVVRALRCSCGKVHATAGISATTVCECGDLLYPLLWDGTAR